MIELPTLYALRTDKKIKQWSVHTENDLVVMTHGTLGGKQTATKTRAIPTNRGRTNERLGAEQAQFEAAAAWKKKKDEGYFESIQEAQTTKIILPMLAHSAYVDRSKKGIKTKELRPLKFPLSAQRKLNGLRCLATRNRFISREGVEWNLPHVREHVRWFLTGDDEYLDGEIYIHGVPLQKLNSLIKDYRIPESLALEYHVYDYPCDNREWRLRHADLVQRYAEYAVRTTGTVIKLVETIEAQSMEDVVALEKIAVELEGYEGLILRQYDKPYVFAGRCDSILKWKRFTDAEFLILDVLPRELIKGKESLWICDKFLCKNNTNDRTFEVVPKGTEAERAEFLANKESYIGQQLTVRFLERSIDGIPQGNPVGSFRMKEDTPAEEDEEWTS